MLFRLRRFLDVRAGEGLPVLLSFVYVACVVAAFLLAKPIRNGLYLREYGAYALVYAYAAVPLALWLFVPTYAAIANRIGLRLAAIGTLPGKILSLFLIEGFFNGLAGAAAGLAVALAIVFGLYSWQFSFDFGQATGLILAPTLDLDQVIVACAMVIGVSVVASLQPAYKASRMEPIEALRHV